MRCCSSAGVFAALLSGGMVAGSAAFAIGACSSSSENTGVGGSDAAQDAPVADAPRRLDASEELDSSKPSKAQCRARCRADHPNAIPKEDAIDRCWAERCAGPCVDQNSDFDGGGDPGDGGADAGGGDAAGGGVCGTADPSGISAACDRCTDARCCDAWKACFDDSDCAAYDYCYGACAGP